MEKVSKPKVKLLAKGKVFTAKQMEGRAGALLPKHSANVESVVVVTEGECIFKMADADHRLKQGDAFVVRAGVKHQIKVVEDFKAVHIMPHDIAFEYFD